MKKSELLRAAILNGGSLKDLYTKYALVMGLLREMQEGHDTDSDEFELLVEDTVGSKAVSTRKAKKLIEETNAFVFEDGRWKYNEAYELNGQTVTFSDFTALFMEKPSEGKAIRSSSDPTKSSIISGINWMLKTTEIAIQSGDINGLPAFFSCTDEGDKLIGNNVAETATSDALSMLCQSAAYLSDCGKTVDEITACISFLIEKTMVCQCADFGWDKGGFMPLEDQQESDHPTVEATCLGLWALITFYEERKYIEEYFGTTVPTPNSDIEQAVINGLDFLLRMQLKDGSFGIYKYENGTEAPPNENCTRLVQSTMGMCKGSGIFDNTGRMEMYSVCSKVISDTYQYLSEHTAEYGDYTVWAPYFGKRAQDYPIADVTFSAARVCRSFIPVWYQMEDERENVIKYNKDFLSFWRENEDKIINQVGYYRFNSPTAFGFSAGEYFWPSRADMLAAFSVLQAYNRFGIALTKDDWRMIESTVRRTLEIQHPHGHWDNPLAVKTPFCAVTLAAIELLQEYRIAKGLE